jgi:hypothetical protein
VAAFTPDACYRSSVFREPHRGSQAIRSYWQRAAGAQHNVIVRMGQPVVGADRVVVEWWTTMTDPDQGEVTLPGCLLLRFAADGRCSDLWEYWQLQPGWQEPPARWGGSSAEQRPATPPAGAGYPAARFQFLSPVSSCGPAPAVGGQPAAASASRTSLRPCCSPAR